MDELDFFGTDTKTELEKALDVFGDYLCISNERLEVIAKRNNLTVNEAELIAQDCAQNADETLLDRFHEHKGDGVALGKWFDSYFEECLSGAI